jgi:hypothetical protein
VRVVLSVRRSATEAAGTRAVTGGYAVADLVTSPSAIPPADRAARFGALAAHDDDRLVASQPNFLYVRVANAGTVRAEPARVRLFELSVGAPPSRRSEPALGSATQPLAPGESGVVEVQFDPGAREHGSRVFVLVVADLAATPADPPPDLPTFEAWHAYTLAHPSTAIRELVVA